MLSVVNIRAQISSVIDALSQAAVAEIAKVVEDGMVVWRLEICQRDDEILKLKDNIAVLNNELKAATGGQDRGMVVLTEDDRPGSDVANDACNEKVLDKDPSKGGLVPEVQVKREPGEKTVSDAREAPLAQQQGTEQTRFERESGTTWRANSMYNAAGLGGTSDYLGLAEGLPPPGPPPAPTGAVGGGGSSGGVVVGGVVGGGGVGGGSAAVQPSSAAREQLAFSYYRNNYNPVRWRNIKSLMFKRGFACLYCGKNFSRRAHLERHKLIHTGEKPYVCELCGRRFNQKSSVKEHMKIHQKGLQLQPEIQGAAEHRQDPEEELSADTPHAENGGQSTVKDELLLLHEEAHPATLGFPVKSGPEVKVAARPLNPCPGGSHPAREAGVSPAEDVKVFDRDRESWPPGPHVKKNPGTSNGVTGRSSMPSGSGHGSSHPAPPREHLRPFNMSVKPYRSPSDAATSLTRYSGSPGSFGETAMSANFNCMPWQPHWARRNPSFEPAKPKKCFVCPFCCKVFERSGHLERHVRIHTGEKPYGCQICGRFFNQKGSLKIHLKTHRTEQSIEMLEALQQDGNPQPQMIAGTSMSGPPALGGRIPDSPYDAGGGGGGEPPVTVKLEPETTDYVVLPPGNAHQGIADDANFLWTSIIEDGGGRSLSPLASTYSAHAASVVSNMVKDWLGPGGEPHGAHGAHGAQDKEEVPSVKGKEDMEMMLQETYAGVMDPSREDAGMDPSQETYAGVMDPSREDAAPFEVPDLDALEGGCGGGGGGGDKQNGFICLTCGTSYECWTNFESHQCKDPS
ncbi:unnamed protein product [Boreogadus saida]